MRSLKLLGYLIVGSLILLLLIALIHAVLPAELKFPFLRVVALIAAILCPIIILIDLFFLIPTIYGAVYFPSSDPEVTKILTLAQVKKNQSAVDIGSGDGRIVRVLAEQGAQAYGYELNPVLVLLSLWRHRQSSAFQRMHFRWQNLWWSNFSSFDVVVIFGMTYIMSGLEKKLMNELKPGAKIICNSFPFPNWKPDKKIDNIYLYIKK